MIIERCKFSRVCWKEKPYLSIWVPLLACGRNYKMSLFRHGASICLLPQLLWKLQKFTKRSMNILEYMLINLMSYIGFSGVH